MAIGDQVGKSAADEITHEAIPAALAGITANVNVIAATVNGVGDLMTNVVIPAFASGVDMVEKLGWQLDSRLDGATIEIDLKVNGNIPVTGTVRLRCPVGAEKAE